MIMCVCDIVCLCNLNSCNVQICHATVMATRSPVLGGGTTSSASKPLELTPRIFTSFGSPSPVASTITTGGSAKAVAKEKCCQSP